MQKQEHLVDKPLQDSNLTEYFVLKGKQRAFDYKKLIQNIVGMRFGLLVVESAELSFANPRKAICHCVCDCGNTRDVALNELVAPHGVRGCGVDKKCSCRNHARKELVFTKDQLLELYINKNLTVKQVADLLGTTGGSLRRYFRAYGIKKTPEKILESIAKTKEEKEKLKPPKVVKMTSWVVYKHTSPEGKCYIGQTRKLGRRWSAKSGSGYEGSTKFCDAIKKFGWENFTHEILEDNIQTQEEALEREEYWIAFYDSYHNGYNGTPGGKNGRIEKRPIYQIEPDTKRIVNKFDSLGDAVRATGISAPCISQCCSRIIQTAGKYCWCYVDEFSDSWEMPVSSVRRGRRIVCIETGEIFHSPQELAKAIGVGRSQITRVCSIEEYKGGTIRGKHYCYLGDEDNFVPKGNKCLTSVRCVETGEEYESITAAWRKTTISYDRFKTIVKNGKQTPDGLHWEVVKKSERKR